ncbi:MAG: aspartyl-phosphate phosphatase Spo0E family protein [Clostridiales bacterium]|jgi:hypothetical protein|nr:aspartyl-phosphate phosphatase Spo0E family protein [Clostridiales bacterium]
MEQLDELTEKIEAMRRYIHKLLQMNNINSCEILKASQQLDQLLVEYYKLINNED